MEKKSYRVVNFWGYYKDGVADIASHAVIKGLFHQWGVLNTPNGLVTVGIIESIGNGRMFCAIPDCMNFLLNEIPVER